MTSYNKEKETILTWIGFFSCDWSYDPGDYLYDGIALYNLVGTTIHHKPIKWRKKMNTIELTGEMLIMLLPLIAIQLGLIIYCVTKILKEGVENLNKWAWIAICVFLNLIGPIIFLIVGRKRDV